MEVITEGRNSKWDIDSIKNHISTFDTLKNFYDDPTSKEISAWISNRKNRTGDKSLSMKNLLSELIKKDEKQLTENFKIKFPQYDFQNVRYETDENGYKIIKGVSCTKKDNKGVVHGELKGVRLNNLTNYTCEKCYSEHMDNKFPQSLEGKINVFKSYIPKELSQDFDFKDAEFDLIKRSNRPNQTRLVVKNIKCISKNHGGKPVILFPDWTRADKINFEFACPVCNNVKKVDWKGESKMINFLISLGYVIQKNKRIGAYSVKGTGLRNRLQADAYFVKEDGTVVIAEFDGEQHFFPKEGRFKGLEGFKERVENDLAKNKFCLENGIKLIRIGYRDFSKIESELVNALSMEPMKDIYLSSKYPPLGWNDPKRTIPTQSSESKIKRNYVLTESQLKRILEIASDEKILNSIKKYVLSRFDEVEDVKFYDRDELQSPTERRPSLTKKVVEIVFDRSKVSFVGMLHNKYEVEKALESFFDIQTKDQDSEWEITIGEK